MRREERVTLSEGSGGKEMHELIAMIAEKLYTGDWEHIGDDSASFVLDKKRFFFTTDSYVVSPIFFPGGDIGKIAFCGTVNDLAVMGAKPLGISLGLVLEEGFEKEKLFRIIDSIAMLSKKTKIPVTTGDTKVMEHGSVDKIIISTSGIGYAERPLDIPLAAGDKLIVSGGIGEHGTALLARRFEIETTVVTDSKPLWEEIDAIKHLIKQAKDVTRGGLAGVLNELAMRNNVSLLVDEGKVPMQKEVHALTELLGIDAYSLACEGRFVCIAPAKNAGKVVALLTKFNKMAAVVGEVSAGKGVTVQTQFGKRLLNMPSGILVPRIC